VRQKTNKIDENTKKLADRQDEIQKEIDDEFEEIEDALKQVDEEEIIKALEEADAEHEKNIIEALNNL
jgi:oligoendopeptidase F